MYVMTGDLAVSKWRLVCLSYDGDTTITAMWDVGGAVHEGEAFFVDAEGAREAYEGALEMWAAPDYPAGGAGGEGE